MTRLALFWHVRINGAPQPPAGVGGWLLVLCGLLLVWQPLSLAIVASSALEAVPVRGVPLVLVLFARLLATSCGIAAGLALAGRRSHAVALAKTSLVASAATDLFTYTTPFFPNNRLPGASAIVVAASMIYYVSWLAYLSLSRRVKHTYGR